MAAKYLVRFDDICPDMHWETWLRIEKILETHGIKPLLAVVPDNHDDTLKVNVPNPKFWEAVRRWQAAGWAIGLHGYQHLYMTRSAGLIGLNKFSEFAGLPSEQQASKIDSGLAIFARENIRADAWIAPGHSFDKTTVQVLRDRGINIVSDGYFYRAVRYLGAIWIPQQLWRFERKRDGVWTVCFHHNGWSEADILRFEQNIIEYSGDIVSLASLSSGPSPEATLSDFLFSGFYRYKIQTFERIKLALQGSRLTNNLLQFMAKRHRQ